MSGLRDILKRFSSFTQNSGETIEKGNDIFQPILMGERLKTDFALFRKVKIENILDESFAEKLYAFIHSDKNWNLSSGIDNIKYEKGTGVQFQKMNELQIQRVHFAFSEDRFSYFFHRSMNNTRGLSYFEFKIREKLNSVEFISVLNEITGLGLTKLNTMFLSKYKSGHFLAPHSDRGNGTLAFVLYLTKGWKPQYGGNLHFMNEARTEITESFTPCFNSMVLFEVPVEKGIPHYIGHVAPHVKQNRYAITGWFI